MFEVPYELQKAFEAINRYEINLRNFNIALVLILFFVAVFIFIYILRSKAKKDPVFKNINEPRDNRCGT